MGVTRNMTTEDWHSKGFDIDMLIIIKKKHYNIVVPGCSDMKWHRHHSTMTSDVKLCKTSSDEQKVNDRATKCKVLIKKKRLAVFHFLFHWHHSINYELNDPLTSLLLERSRELKACKIYRGSKWNEILSWCLLSQV